MSCADVRELLTDVAGGELDGARADEVRAHAASCAVCAAASSRSSRQTIGLVAPRRRASRCPRASRCRCIRRSCAPGAPRRSWLDVVRAAIALRPVTFAASAAALAAMLATGGTLALFHRAHAPHRLAASYNVPESKVALVKIDFVAEKTIDDVAFEITLPDGLRFVSGGERAGRAHLPLLRASSAAGSNPIPIAVKGPRAGRYKVIAHAIGPALDVTHEVVLEVTT